MPFPPASTRLERLGRLPQFMVFLAFTAWYFGAGALAASAANGLAFRLRLVMGRGLLEACFHLFLLLVGFVGLQGVARLAAPVDEVTALPKRPTAGREWLVGAAVGWGIAAATVMPLIVLGRLRSQIAFGGSQMMEAGFALATLAVATLAHEMTFRGYPFRCLTKAVGTSGAVLLMALAAGVWAGYHVPVPGVCILASMLLTGLLCLCWLRTYAVWLAWGLHFALAASMGVLFGLPADRLRVFSSVVHSRAYGPAWLTGGESGPMGSLFALAVLGVGIVVVYRATRDLSWRYTHREIVAGGAVVNVAPPAAHIAMEQQAPAPAGLVQILATTPASISATPLVSGAPPPRDRLN